MTAARDDETTACTRRHLRLGWWSLLVFLVLGAALETMHGFKIGWYLDVSNETRRMMLRLAHAHGALLAVLHLVFASTVRQLSAGAESWCRLASACLTGAALLLPGGFFLGGMVVYGGDPWIGILLVPVGALLLFTAVLFTAVGVGRAGASS